MKKFFKLLLVPLIASFITLFGSIYWLYGVIESDLSYVIFILSLLPFLCSLILIVCSIVFKEKKNTNVLIVAFTILLIFWTFVYYIGLFIYTLFFVVAPCSKDLIQSVESPNGEYTIKMYRRNCGATTDFSVTGELCDNNKCKKIYNCYHEEDSLVYWIDNKTVFINNKKLNIYDDEYDWRDDDNYQDKLYEK